jgi:hypothetical protein
MHQGHGLRAAVLGGLIALLLAACGSKDAFVIDGDSRLGGFPSDGTLQDAIQVFGDPESRDQPGGGDQCTLTWPSLGLTMQTYYPGAVFDPCGPRAKHAKTTARRGKWHTSDGLEIGDPLSKLREHYPKAYEASPNTWQLIARPLAGVPFPGLEAALMNGRIVSFTIYGPPSAF